MKWSKLKTSALMLACLPIFSTCSTEPWKPKPLPMLPVETRCPEPAPIIDRSFRNQPPMCMVARQSFRFTCTPDPAKPGYCKETFADAGLSAVGRIADDKTCMKLTSDWIAAERVARDMKAE